MFFLKKKKNSFATIGMLILTMSKKGKKSKRTKSKKQNLRKL